MNKNNAKEYFHIVEALAEGKIIQYQRDPGVWIDIEEVKFSGTPNNYRIKSEPEYIPFKSIATRNPIGRLVVDKIKGEILMIVGMYAGGFMIGVSSYSFEKAFEKYEFEDGTPLGVLKQ